MKTREKDKDQEKFVLQKYTSGNPDQIESYLRTLIKFMNDSKSPEKDNQAILASALQIIQALTKFRECTIGLRDPDGLFRFKAMIGFQDEAIAARKEVAYTNEDMKDIFSYRPVNICRFTHFHLSERKPYKSGMEKTYNKPEFLGIRRRHPDDMIEGDYLEIVIHGKAQDIIGWLELSGTSDQKLPSRDSVLKMEFLSTCLAPILQKMIG